MNRYYHAFVQVMAEVSPDTEVFPTDYAAATAGHCTYTLNQDTEDAADLYQAVCDRIDVTHGFGAADWTVTI